MIVTEEVNSLLGGATPEPAPEASPEIEAAAAEKAAEKNYEWSGDTYERPDFIPERLWGETPPEALLGGEEGMSAQLAHMKTVLQRTGKSYDHLDKKLKQGKAEVPDEYDTSRFSDTVDSSDVALQKFAEKAKEFGLSQDQFQEVVGSVLEVVQEQAEIDGVTELTNERRQEIAQELGDNADDIIGEINSTANSLVDKGELLPQDWQELTLRAGRDAASIRALHTIIKGAKPHQISATAGGATPSKPDASLKAQAALDADNMDEFVAQAAQLLGK